MLGLPSPSSTVSSTILCFLSLLTRTSSLALPNPNPNPHRHALSARASPPAPPLPTLSGLPSPPSSLSLKYIGLGLGTQNYTCNPTSSSSTSSTTPASIGALATLYDATPLFLAATGLPASLSANALAALETTLTCAADVYDTALGLSTLGHHYFDSLARPTFDLSGAAAGNGGPAFLSAKKVADVPAPVGSATCAGRDGGGAVDWLMLEDCGDGDSRGVSVVYRLDTAGGKAVGACAVGAEGTVTSDYSALYYFFG